ncbi:NAD(P)-binding protein [Sodiomyces alkalinus F11]|uniref:NAD(P)-binding protein n=1 Tax=Sodiomyces alkalinus (strain CBS 110278 / VKM F-3762 / F11) TaxID=1314773 RepID=A0A3N2Q6F5_SODAK|nr:NAD(P)-binding protein [Sodiomyces alkalinus F11]ROT42351.1 NAD(P)-binding protein [Sodiomyces alkalinus F11]
MPASRALLPLRGRHCLITGASGGIGAAIARRFAAEGALVTLTGRNESKLRRILADLPPFPDQALSPVHAASSPKSVPPSSPENLCHAYRRLDLSNRGTSHNPTREDADANETYSEQNTVLDAIWDRTGQIDVLVNAAGVAQWQLIQKTSLQDAREVLDTNLLGAVLTSKYMARRMKKRRADRDACIINIASLLAQKGVPGASVYAASKAGLLGLTHALAVELAPMRIRSNAIVPGYIETEMIANMSKEPLEKKIPLGRLGTAEEVADAAVFLAQNPYANNCILNLDGGLSAV